MLLSVLSVFFTAMLELWAAIPLGFVLKLDPWINAIATIAGATAGVAVVVFAGEGLRAWIIKMRNGNKESQPKATADKKPSAIENIWRKYGIIGLGLLAPWITGAPLGAALGMSLGADPKKLLIWITAGSVICTIILTAMGAAGVSLIKK